MKKLEKQMQFLIEADKLKSVFRQSLLADGSRHENDAEHSWHMSMMAVILSEYAPENTDILHSIKMILIHDLVEIYAGDTYLYDVKGNEDKQEREEQSAEKIFGMLPHEQAEEIKKLWYEFEECNTKEAGFANTLDRLQPVMLNYLTEGKMWKKHNVSSDMVIKKAYRLLENADENIKNYFLSIIDESVKKGYLTYGGE